MGEYQHSLDAKGRIFMPAKLRELLGDSFIITRGLDRCLFVYPPAEWQAIEQKFRALPVTRADARKFTRFFFSGAVDAELDKQGRVNIPAHLREYAHLEKDCVIIGVSNRVEIWSYDEWQKYYEESEESFAEIAETIVDFQL